MVLAAGLMDFGCRERAVAACEALPTRLTRRRDLPQRIP
jgi:hypothetical protein